MNKEKTYIDVLCLNGLEQATLVPESERLKLYRRKDTRYICTDFEISNCDIYEDANGELYALPSL